MCCSPFGRLGGFPCPLGRSHSPAACQQLCRERLRWAQQGPVSMGRGVLHTGGPRPRLKAHESQARLHLFLRAARFQ